MTNTTDASGAVTASKEPKTTYKYHLKNEANRTIHRDITTDLVRREKEHQVRWPGSHIIQIGRRTTVGQAQKWLKMGGGLSSVSPSSPKHLSPGQHQRGD